jgi:hypothetical protein
MAIDRIPGVGPTNADIATAVAAPSAATIAAAVAAPSAATIAAAVAAPSAATIASTVAGSVPTLAQITSTVQANAGSPFGGTWTNIASTRVNGNNISSITWSSLSGYKYLRIIVQALSYNNGSNDSQFGLRINGDTGANYVSTLDVRAGAHSSVGLEGAQQYDGNIWLVSSSHVASRSSRSFFFIEIDGSNSSKIKDIYYRFNYYYPAANQVYGGNGYAIWNSTAAISSLTFFNTGSTNFSDGFINVMGAA